MSDEQEALVLSPETWTDSPRAIVEDMLDMIPKGLTINGADSGPVSAQVAQILIAAKRSAHTQSQRFAIIEPSEDLVQSLNALGLSDLLAEESE